MIKKVGQTLLLAAGMTIWAELPALAIVDFNGAPFTVNESTVPSSLPNTVAANGIAFTYQARINQAADGSFVENGFLTESAFVDAAAAALPSQLNTIPPIGYRLYGLFSIAGATQANPAGGSTATFDSFDLSLWLDPSANTKLKTTGVTSGAADDTLLATFTLNFAGGEAHLFSGLASGDFNALLDLSLTSPGGTSFFNSPDPFYTLEDISGNVATLSGQANAGQAFTAMASGAGLQLFVNPPEVNFPGALPPPASVPEPATIALLLVGLGALGLARRGTLRAC